MFTDTDSLRNGVNVYRYRLLNYETFLDTVEKMYLLRKQFKHCGLNYKTLFYLLYFNVGWLVVFEDLRRFSDLSAISRLGSRR